MAKLNEKDEEKKVVNNAPSGVDEETWSNTQTPYEKSQELQNREKNTQNTYSNLESLTTKDSIISDQTKKNLNSSFVVPSAVTEADTYLAQQLEKIQSGKTSFSDDVRAMMDKITNREKFSYDVDTDPLFQQALASAMNSGKQAMQDTIGQASALTGGYGSTYATTAGNQSYNAFIEDAYNNLPQYYQMAMEAYQMEGDELYRQLGMYTDADDREYNRNVTAYDATYQHRNRMYDEAYNMYRDEKSDAYAMANLELNEHGQRVSDAYNLYNAASNQEDKLYEREYNSWSDSINMAFKTAEMQNSDYWSQTNFDEGVRQYEKNFAENVRQYDTSLAENKRQYDESLAFNKQQHADQMSYNWANLNQKKSGNGGDGTKEPTQTQMSAALKAYNEGGINGLKTYLASVPSDYDIQSIADYAASYGESWVSEYDSFQGWELSNDTNNGWWVFGKGEDHNDEYSKTDANGNKTTLTYDALKKQINSSNIPDEKKKELLKQLQGQSKK